MRPRPPPRRQRPRRHRRSPAECELQRGPASLGHAAQEHCRRSRVSGAAAGARVSPRNPPPRPPAPRPPPSSPRAPAPVPLANGGRKGEREREREMPTRRVCAAPEAPHPGAVQSASRQSGGEAGLGEWVTVARRVGKGARGTCWPPPLVPPLAGPRSRAGGGRPSQPFVLPLGPTLSRRRQPSSTLAGAREKIIFLKYPSVLILFFVANSPKMKACCFLFLFVNTLCQTFL
jgi:hypothetical protein